MFGNEDHGLGSPSPAYLGVAIHGEDWKPGPIDDGPVATRPTEKDRQAASNSIMPEMSKILWAAIWGALIAIIVFCILIYPRQMAEKKESQTKSQTLQHEALCLNATLNTTMPDCTAFIVPQVASNLARSWEESTSIFSTTLIPTTMVSVFISSTAGMEMHGGFITRVRSDPDEGSITSITID
ncbi:uncharacterized protein N7477_005323 [Penicillium maclennaniae]|uniref:uncharacterized protein n=1 Tax=Penicillium maclennaniae TaxID=1343394 RepID=UPI0025419842|nr:uncharacterized protein N7477_005323 [Penicillium maclennaniae]KAJ5669960.1 hypothetical protein N7477_005323 [Penicillium maclennaniae]